MSLLTFSAISSLVFILIYAITDGLSDSYQILQNRIHSSSSDISQAEKELEKKYNSRWHWSQALRQAFVLGYILAMTKDVILFLICLWLFWLIHDVVVNMVGLNKNLFFIGTTAKFDIWLRKILPEKNLFVWVAILKIIPIFGLIVFYPRLKNWINTILKG